MTRVARRYELGVSAIVVAVFVAYWAAGVAMSKPPEFQSQYVLSVLLVSVLAALWVLAVRLLWRAWWARDVAGLPVVDGPAVVLAAAAATLPEERREWGRALVAELPHVTGRAARWSFAIGGARTALFPPPGRRRPALVVAALAALAVVAVWLVVGATLPALQVFALAFGALAGGMAAWAATRPRGGPEAGAGPVIATAGVVGVAVGIVATTSFLARYPTAAAYLAPPAAMVLAVVLAGCLWLVLAPPRGLTTSRLARGLGVGAALLLGLGFLLLARLPPQMDGGVMAWIALAPVVILFATAALAAAVGRAMRVGVQAAVWAALLGALFIFAAWLPEASARYDRYGLDAGLLLDGDTAPVGVNLADAIGGLVLVLALGLPMGVIGAAFGAAGSPRAIGLKVPRSPALASLALCLPLPAVVVIATNDLGPFGSWFAPDQPLAPVGQVIVLGSVVCLLLAPLYALTALSRQVARLVAIVRQRR